MNCLSLASKKKSIFEQIIQHKLDLNENGDYDFSKPRSSFSNNIHAKATNTMKSKSVKFGGESSSSAAAAAGTSTGGNQSASVNSNANNNTNNNNNSISVPGTTNVIESPFETNSTHQQQMAANMRSIKIKEQASKFAKSVFSKKTTANTENLCMAESPSTLLLG